MPPKLRVSCSQSHIYVKCGYVSISICACVCVCVHLSCMCACGGSSAAGRHSSCSPAAKRASSINSKLMMVKRYYAVFCTFMHSVLMPIIDARCAMHYYLLFYWLAVRCTTYLLLSPVAVLLCPRRPARDGITKYAQHASE